jgi:hypothetical protein
VWSPPEYNKVYFVSSLIAKPTECIYNPITAINGVFSNVYLSAGQH